MEDLMQVEATSFRKKANIKKRDESNKIPEDPFDSMYEAKEAIEPPLDPYELAVMVQISNILPQCVEAMEQNCEGYGYNLNEVLEDEDKTPAIEAAMEKEKKFIKNFMKYASYETSFTKLRKRLRRDKETLGNAYMEILRNEKGDIDGFEYIKGITMRLGPLSKPIDFTIYKKDEETLEYKQISYRKRFRTYIQLVGMEKVYFKELGDPRNINALTGEPISEEEMNDNENQPILANEVYHFFIDDPLGPYGTPRWSGNLVSVTGSRQSEEVNMDYFGNKTIPPMVITVSGGEFGKKTHQRIRDFLENEIKGKENFHNILVLEAQGAGNPHSLNKSGVDIGINQLTQMTDGMFQDYDKNNREKIRSSFRLPPIYVGLTDDYTRATAKESKEVAEEQVFTPEKADFDFFINHRIFPELGIKYFEFETKSAPIDNTRDMVDAIKVMNDTGATNEETRKMLKTINNQIEELDPNEEGNEWLKFPMRLAQMAVRSQSNQSKEPNGKEEEDDQGQQSKGINLGKSLILALSSLAKELRNENKSKE